MNIVKVTVDQVAENDAFNYTVFVNDRHVHTIEYPKSLGATSASAKMRSLYELLKGSSISINREYKGDIQPINMKDLVSQISQQLSSIKNQMQNTILKNRPVLVVIDEVAKEDQQFQHRALPSWGFVFHLPIHLCLYDLGIPKVYYTSSVRCEKLLLMYKEGNFPYRTNNLNFTHISLASHFLEDIVKEAAQNAQDGGVIISTQEINIQVHQYQIPQGELPQITFLDAPESASPMHHAKGFGVQALGYGAALGPAGCLNCLGFRQLIGYLYTTQDELRKTIRNEIMRTQHQSLEIETILRNIVVSSLRQEEFIRGNSLTDVILPDPTSEKCQKLFTLLGLICVV